MELEAFHELCVIAEMKLGADQFQTLSLAGERVIRLSAKTAEDWLLAYYDRKERRAAA